MDRSIERRARSPLALGALGGEDLLTAPGQRPFRDGFLATDVYETESSYVVKASVPGISVEDIKITRAGDTVTLEGEVKPASVKEGRYLYQERSYGQFSRTLPLPDDAGNDVNATLENGVLVLEFAKPAERVPHTISIKSAQ